MTNEVCPCCGSKPAGRKKPDMIITKQLNSLLKSRKLTVHEFSLATGIKERSIIDWKAGRRHPPKAKRDIIETVYKTTFVDDSDYEKKMQNFSI